VVFIAPSGHKSIKAYLRDAGEKFKAVRTNRSFGPSRGGKIAGGATQSQRLWQTIFLSDAWF
jgi:hypothetical protein